MLRGNVGYLAGMVEDEEMPRWTWRHAGTTNEVGGSSDWREFWSRRTTNFTFFTGINGIPNLADNTRSLLFFFFLEKLAKQALVWRISHDIRYPVSGIQHHFSLLKNCLRSTLHHLDVFRDYGQCDIVVKAFSEMDMILASKF